MVKEKKTPKIRPEYRVVSSGALDLANFAGEIVSNPDTVLVSLGGELKNYAKLLRDDQVHSLLEQRQDALIAAETDTRKRAVFMDLKALLLSKVVDE